MRVAAPKKAAPGRRKRYYFKKWIVCGCGGYYLMRGCKEGSRKKFLKFSQRLFLL